MSEKLIDVDMWVESHERGTKDARSTGSHGGAGFSQSNHVDRADRADIADRAETADEANHAKESDHAKTADEANHAKTADEVKLESKTLSHFLRKDIQDTVVEVLTFLKGIVAKDMSYFKGIFNDGDITNSGTITTKNLNVTGKATFFELEIQKAKAAGGMSVNSAGTFHIDAVEETPDGFVCYQRAEKDGVKLLQTCEPKDQMMCSNGMNILEGGKGNHFYWRKATEAPKEVVTHTIDGKEEKCLKLVLSKTDHSKNTVDIPQVGDDLVQIGNPDNKERQSVIMTCAYNSFDGDLKAPYWVQYDGVNDYKLSTHKRTWFAANGSQVTGNFKVQSDNGGLESIEDYMKGLATNTYKLVMSSSQFNVKADGSFSPQFISIYAYKVQGENLTQLSPSDNVKVHVNKGENKLPIKENSLVVRSDKWNLWADKEDMNDVFNVDLYINDNVVDKQKIHIVRDGRNGQNGKDGINGEKGTDGKDGTNGKDAVSYKLIPSKEIAVAYIDSQTPRKKVKVEVGYFIQKAVGDVTTTVSLYSEGLTLRAYPALGDLKGSSGTYGFGPVTRKYDSSEDIFSVTLLKGNKILDKRTIPLVMKPKVVFDIDTEQGKITSQIEAANGKINSVERDLNQTKATVGDLNEQYTQLNMKSDEISLTVNNGTRPNLLWGSDLDLSEVQDKIRLAYHNGDVIQQNTAKKEELQRQLNATSTNDTAKRNELQTKIDICNDAITAARNKVSECKAAIQKHLGVGIANTKIDSEEWFQYIKGEGVGGGDAIKFKTLAGVSEYPGLFWEKQCGGKCNIKLKQHTTYTLSAWVKVEFDKKADGYVGFGFEAFKNEDSMSGRKPNNASRLNFNENPAFSNPTDGWIRFERTFTTDDLDYGSVTMNINGTKPATLYICRPKLEEGNKATPWCAYDGTVEGLKRTGINIEDGEIRLDAKNTIVSDNLSVGSLKTEPKVKGDPFIEAHDGEFNIFTFERKKGIELSVDDSGMPHLIFYDKDGNPAYDLGWTGMKQLTDAVVQDYWSADFLMKEDSYTDATRVSKITRDKCKEYYTYHAAYNRKSGTYGSNEEYNKVTFVEKNFSKQRIADGFYYPMNNGSLARVANESAYIYGTRKYQYSNGKMIGYEVVYIEKDPVTGAWRFSNYKGGLGSSHGADQHSQP